ncbi:MAG: hypothetical protein PUJ68_06055 [[Actinobacillus] rossii]|nr:hypothetical protein [[Actinobacillus] rossii]MDY5793947.1 hypothetical protein [[Actinobacillus] rossii]
MTINFTQLFQDCWNFVRNQRQFVVSFMIIFVLATGALSFVHFDSTVSVPENITEEQAVEIMLQQAQSSTAQLAFVMQRVLSLFISAWGIMAIHHISLGNGLNLSVSATQTLRRFLGVMLLTFLCILPITLGLMSGMAALAQQQTPSIWALFLIIAGVFLFIRLCLAPISYLVGDTELKNTVQNMLKLGYRRSGALFLYCLIAYFLFPLIIMQLTLLANNVVFFIIVLIGTAFINIFSLVFSYRFYTIFKQKAY